MKKIIIAIDGYSSCGKSTIAKDLSKALGYIYINTGAMYRAVTLYFLNNNVNINDVQAVEKALENIHIQFLFDTEKGNRTILNDKDVENELGTMRVANFVSPVSTVSAVRREMVRQQQQIGRQKGVVLEGRDIGTVVFPDAELKLFVTSEVQIRVQRRLRELLEKGQKVDFETIKANLLERDFIDTTRSDSPLKKADDAIILDNSYLNRAEQLEVALNWARERCI